MKKYLKLTSQEAVQYFIHRDGTLIPETTEEIKQKLNDLHFLRSEISVSVTMPTHRTFPDSDKDIVQLKNLIAEADKKLSILHDKRKRQVTMENIEEAAGNIDHRLNLDSLVIYANEHFSSVVKLPVTTNPEVVIDPLFDIRPLYRSRQQNQHYYILSISRQKIRLFEAFNDKITEEINNEDFPFENNYYTTDPIKLKQDIFEENLVKEFFNVADKRFRKYLISNPLPIILAGDTKSVSYYQEMMDHSQTIIAQVNGNYDNSSQHEIIKAVYPVIEKFRENEQHDYLSEIDNARSGNLLSADMNEMIEFSLMGNVRALFTGNNYGLEEATVKDSTNKTQKRSKTLLLIENVRKAGGKIIFLEDKLLEKHNGIVLVKRF
ncbi:MAG: hypothetical protein LBQ22_01435 [Bacteroidales bacterium]|jgi:hypothetical protein|nr:hypothetical protein [Bacteroidales bacterium]